jgi:hypothetical protein
MQGVVREGYLQVARRGHLSPLRRAMLVAGLSLAILAFASSPALAAPEAPETLGPAKAITPSTAELTGILNPHSAAKAGWFFAYAQGLSCTEGATTPQEAEVEGEALPEHAEATGLQPSRQYTFCLVATNEAGETTFGLPEVSFTTPPLPPAIDSQGTSGVTPFEAHFEGLVNANNQATTCKFEYGETTAYGNEASCALESPEAFGDQEVAASVTGLQAKTTYHFRIVAENAAKERTEHADGAFTTLTLEAPLVGAESVSGLNSTGATLNALINPNYQETTFAFEYATDEALTGATTVEGPAPLPAVFAEEPASAETGTLQPRTTYFYRAVATNAAGMTQGAVEHFTTLGAPIATAAPAQSITRASATLSGTVNPGGTASTDHFVYVSAAGYEPSAANPYANAQATPEASVTAADYAPHPTGSVPALGLLPGTTYHYALLASNSAGTITSPDNTFTTAPPTAPVVQTGGASAIAQNSASIAAIVNGQGLQTSYAFEVGTSAGSYGPAIEVGNIPAGAGEQAIALVLNGLLPGTTYHYRVTATNLDGTREGEDRAFTTSPASTLAVLQLPFLAVPSISFPTGSQANTGTGPPKALTKAQKLKKALKACRAKHDKHKRASCERQARKRYAPAKRRGRR